MKKITSILALTVVVVTGCSKNETEEGTKAGAITGNWKITTQTLQSGASSEPQDITDKCAHLNQFHFKADGNFSIDNVYYDSQIQNCKDAQDDNGTWMSKGNGAYEIKSPGKPTFNIQAKFSSDEKSMTLQFFMGGTENKYTYLMERI